MQIFLEMQCLVGDLLEVLEIPVFVNASLP